MTDSLCSTKCTEDCWRTFSDPVQIFWRRYFCLCCSSTPSVRQIQISLNNWIICSNTLTNNIKYLMNCWNMKLKLENKFSVLYSSFLIPFYWNDCEKFNEWRFSTVHLHLTLALCDLNQSFCWCNFKRYHQVVNWVSTQCRNIIQNF